MVIKSIITARGGSKGIENKNLIPLKGKPLIYYSIKESLKSIVDETWVSSDCEKILKKSSGYGAKILKRPDFLADDIIMPDGAVKHFAENVSADYIVFIQPTSPLISYKDINNGIKYLKENNYDSIFAARVDHWVPRWIEDEGKLKTENWDIYNRPRRQDRKNTLIEIGMFYICKRDLIIKNGLRYGAKIGCFKIPLKRSFQIDSIEDLELVEKLL
jgi:CMP-N,N'-diacetyllegionaminic acid synthase